MSEILSKKLSYFSCTHCTIISVSGMYLMDVWIEIWIDFRLMDGQIRMDRG